MKNFRESRQTSSRKFHKSAKSSLHEEDEMEELGPVDDRFKNSMDFDSYHIADHSTL